MTVSLFTVAGAPAWTEPSHRATCNAAHVYVLAHALVLVEETPGGRKDIAVFSGPGRVRDAKRARWERAGTELDAYYWCGARSDRAEPADEVLAVAAPCEHCDRYADPDSDDHVECDNDGPMHIGCHIARCSSLSCSTRWDT